MNRLFATLSIASLCGCLTTFAQAQDEPAMAPEQMMEMMQKFATPGEHHELLGGLVGQWKTEMSMMGMPPTEGTAEGKWILGNRFVQLNYAGTMMGQQYEGIALYGYDNYKKKYTCSSIDSMSTDKKDSEGMLDQTGKIINFYGTMDEYLTGEHDKPVKYVVNMTNEDEFTLEIHDLQIGENSKVVGIKFTRVK